MKLLQQLIQLISPSQLKLQDIYSKYMPKNIKLSALYKGIEEGTIKSNEDALEMIFPEARNGKRDLAKLKFDLKKRLLNNVLLYEFEKQKRSQHDRRPAFFEAIRMFASSYFLILLNGRNMGILMLEKKLQEIIEYEFSALVVESSRLLRQHYAVIEKDIDKFEYYNKIVQDWIDKYEAEIRIEGLYLLLMKQFNNSTPNNEVIQQLSKRYYNESKRMLVNEPTSNMIFKFSMIKIILHKSQRQVEQVLNVCNSTIKNLKDKIHMDRAGIITIYFQQMNSFMELGNFKQLQLAIQEALNYVSVGSFNWFKLKQFEYQGLIFHHQYEEAVNIYKTVVEYRQQLERNTILQEEWKLIALSLELLYKMDKIQLESYQRLPSIKVGKIVNEFSLANQHKKGYNINILLFQLLHAILLGNYARAEKQSISINAYRRRHLRDDAFGRVNFFIKMLNYIILNWYDLSRINQYSKENLAKLESISRENIAMELIPLEQVWCLLIEKINCNSQRKAQKLPF